MPHPKMHLMALLLIANLVILPSLAAAQSGPSKRQISKIVGSRNLSAYDFGGHEGCGGFYLKSEASRCEASIEKARNFIWQHWQEKRKGYIIVALGSIDALSDAYIFIEPDKKGNWHIVWRWARIYGIGGNRGEVDDMPDIVNVERKIASDKDYRFRAGTSYLTFVGKDGKEIDTL